MMTSREIVRRTLEFDCPERVARSFSPSDFVGGGAEIPNPDAPWKKVGEHSWRRIDDWGNEWGRVDDNSMGEIVKGALQNLDKVDELALPDFDNPAYYVNAKTEFEAHPDMWHIGSISGFPFSIARKLRRMEQYLVDLLLEREKIGRLHDRIVEVLKIQIGRLKEAGADSIMFCEDWGTQEQLLINPELWRQEYKPRFRTLCNHAHERGLKMFMHSCGKVTEIIPDLIASGIDLLQFDQPALHGIDTLKEMQRLGHITFWCPVDIQKTLQTKDEDAIRSQANELLEKLWQGRGGFIAGFYTDNASIGLEPKWQQIASDEFLKKGKREFFDRK
jgi:hypothetical protein